MQLLAKNLGKYQMVIVSAIAVLLNCSILESANSQGLPSPQPQVPEVIIETQPSESEGMIPEEVAPQNNPSFTPWRRIRLLHTLNKHQGSIDSLLFSPDSSILISGGGSNDAQMRFWSVDSGKHLTKIRAQNTAVLTMELVPEGDILVSGGEDSGIHLWDWQSGEYKATLRQHRSSVTSIKIAPDGKTMISGAADGIKVWDLSTLPYSPLYNLAGLGSAANEVAVNPNGVC